MSGQHVINHVADGPLVFVRRTVGMVGRLSQIDDVGAVFDRNLRILRQRAVPLPVTGI